MWSGKFNTMKQTSKQGKTKKAPKRKSTTRSNYGEFGRQFLEFKDKPVEAIRFLRKRKSGECLKAIKVPTIGYVDFVWGENDKNNKGYGLKHIIEKHGKGIEALGYKIEQFIPIVLLYGISSMKSEDNRCILEGKCFRAVVATNYRGKNKQWLLTAFDVTKKTVKRRSKK